MKKICFITSKENDLLTLVFSKFSDEFKKVGISSAIAYYEDLSVFNSVVSSLMYDKDLLFFIGINGFGANMTIDEPSGQKVLLWEKIKKPFFNLQADPCFSSEMFANVGKIYNPYRVDFLTDVMNLYWFTKIRKSTKNLYTIPSFGAYFKTDAENKFTDILERPIKSMLCLSLCDADYFVNRLKVALTHDATLYLKVFENIVSAFENDLRSDPVIWSDVAFQAEGILFDIENKTHQTVLSEAWHYLRMKRRFSMLNSLSGFPLYLITSGHQLPKTTKLHTDTTINAPVSFNQYLSVLSHTQIHISPPTQYYGFHERQAISMYQQCVSISPPNVAFEEKLAHGRDVLFYHDLQSDLPSVVSNILSKEDDIRRISSNARKSVEALYSPKVSAERFLNVYNALAKSWR